MSEVCAAKLDAENKVVEIIVGEASWAEANLGGRWVQFVRGEEGKTYPGYGAVYHVETQDFVNPEVVVENAS